MAAGKEVILVSSGSIAEGCKRLGWRSRPDEVHRLQAAAAVGQIGLMQAYEEGLKAHGCGSAMILLTHDDLTDRQRYLNARATLKTLSDMSVVPIINENDTVATDELDVAHVTVAPLIVLLFASFTVGTSVVVSPTDANDRLVGASVTELAA